MHKKLVGISSGREGRHYRTVVKNASKKNCLKLQNSIIT